MTPMEIAYGLAIGVIVVLAFGAGALGEVALVGREGRPAHERPLRCFLAWRWRWL